MTAPSKGQVRAELARAKVNLALHVTGKRDDGYHLLESLVVFPQIGDRVSLENGESLELLIDGPFARDLESAGDDNLILKSVRAFAAEAGIAVPSLTIHLSKRLPVASGIGGGSTDAATTLRLLVEHTGTYLTDDRLQALALSLGADVPVCLDRAPQIMRGIGEQLSDGPALPRAGMVLVNPKVSVSTPEVFKRLSKVSNPGLPSFRESYSDLPELVAALRLCRNDLQEAAIQLCPPIQHVLSALESEPSVRIARMSGSGATCYALCDPGQEADIERALRSAHPDWWIASGPIG